MPLPVKVDAINNFLQPTTVKGLQEFVGLINFYNHFFPAAAQVMQPLYQALAGKPRTLILSAEIALAFQGAKQALAQATLLHNPTGKAPVALTLDALAVAVGALEQWSQGVWKPIAFFSKQLRAPELKYSAFDKELLALYLAIRHFRYFLEGRSLFPLLITSH